MDAFTTLAVTPAPVQEVEIPSDFEGSGSGSNQPGCVVAVKELDISPADFEGSGSGSNQPGCVIA